MFLKIFNKSCCLRSENRRAQRGAVLILTVIVLIPVIFSILAFVFDLGRLLIIRRQAQHIADSAALIGTNQLWKKDLFSTLPKDWTTLEGWMDVKPIIRELLLVQHINGAKAFQNTDYFTTGSSTYNDINSNFNHDTIQTTSGQGQVTLTVRRKYQCYDVLSTPGTPILYAIDLDTHPNTYCLANKVAVDITVSQTNTIFASLIGFSTMTTIHRTAESNIRPYPNSCGAPDCATVCGGNGTASDCNSYFAGNPTPCI